MTIQDRAARLPEDAAAVQSDSPDEAPEQLPGKAWVTILAFAAFVVAASGCVIGQLLW